MKGSTTFRISTSTNQPSMPCIQGYYSFMKCLYLSLQCVILILQTIVYPYQILYEIMPRRHLNVFRGRFSSGGYTSSWCGGLVQRTCHKATACSMAICEAIVYVATLCICRWSRAADRGSGTLRGRRLASGCALDD